ncbi:MAG: sigma-70 family RNA polymerase sigma factor [Saprospiraceae bacterium]|nr:sigma-70 family RNA polymerase sigma factor [Saprospiraceae bacterium]MCC6281541.1 sigma-70 family RNA polymerase sigma factor [Saprospiraceae bacterium]
MQNELISRLQQQDRTALSQVYDMYSGALYGVVLRIVQSPELAQQVLQDTFLKVWRNSASYDAAKGRLFTWLLNIARNTAIDATRTAHFRNQKKTENIETLVHKPGNETLNPDHLGIREVVGTLDEKYKSLIDLIYFKGYTQEEVAEETGIPIGTVKTRLRYAMNELRKVFGEANLVAFMVLAEAIRSSLK